MYIAYCVRIYITYVHTHTNVMLNYFGGYDYHLEFRGPLSVFIDLYLKHRFTSIVFFKAILSLLLMYRPDLFDADSWS